MILIVVAERAVNSGHPFRAAYIAALAAHENIVAGKGKEKEKKKTFLERAKGMSGLVPCCLVIELIECVYPCMCSNWIEGQQPSYFQIVSSPSPFLVVRSRGILGRGFRR